ncbi:flagellar biosynthetic protein FliO [Pokkaliibacter sp. CJK22405]|uniref:flagellar biosynthetic protein FliO n=1 Tax=Pokkaliibacter sp. CJK22405 TaxID=3384615 RepID=UPI0039848CAE
MLSAQLNALRNFANLGLLFLLTFFSTVIHAADDTPVAETVPSVVGGSGFSAGTSILNVLTGLIVVFLCMWGAFWFLKRMQGGNTGGRQDWKVVATLHLGPKERLVLVQVGSDQLLLGVTAQEIRRLARYTEPVLPEEAFAGKFAEALTRYRKPKT